MKEYEYKILMRKDELEYIESCLYTGTDKPHLHHVSQTNYYYDTESYALDKAGITCRIREKDGKCSGTVKLHGKADGEENTEISVYLDCVTETLRINGTKLKLMGALHTDRKIYVLPSGIKLVFDVNSYLGECDFEMEIEFTEESRREADKILKDIEFLLNQYCMMCGLDSSLYIGQNGKSKSGRFMEKKRKILNSENVVDVSVKSEYI